MSEAVISSLVRCDEWDRKHEKKDKTAQAPRRVYEEQNPLDTMAIQFEIPWSGESEWEQYAWQIHGYEWKWAHRHANMAVVCSLSRVKCVNDKSENSDNS